MTDHGTTVTLRGVVYKVGYVFVHMEASWERWRVVERRWRCW